VARVHREARELAGGAGGDTGVPAANCAARRGSTRTAGNGAIYYGLGVTEHSQGSTMVMGIANLAMATGNIGREGVGVNPLRGQNNVQGSCDMGSFPHELPGYRHVSDDHACALFENGVGREARPEPGLRIPNMLDAAIDGSFKASTCRARTSRSPTRTRSTSRRRSRRWSAWSCRTSSSTRRRSTPTCSCRAPSFLEKDGTFTNAERRINRVRKVMPPLGGQGRLGGHVALANALGYPMHYAHPSRDHGRDRAR
jgi:formate dehydrogenase major subunit